MAAADAFSFKVVDEALKGRRGQTMLQIYFEADYASDSYGSVYDLNKVKTSIGW